MEPRMKNPAMIVTGAMQPIQSLWASVEDGPVPAKTLALIHLRVSQINGCSVCIDGGWRAAKKAGETDERLHVVAAWRHAPYFNAAERAALALTEAITRISDCPDPVPEEVWSEAARHYDERALATLVIATSTVNVWNRLNVATAQVAGAWAK